MAYNYNKLMSDISNNITRLKYIGPNNNVTPYCETLSQDGLDISFNMLIDGSTNITTFRIQDISINEVLYVSRLTFTLADHTSLNPALFGSTNPPGTLTNGCVLLLKDTNYGKTIHSINDFILQSSVYTYVSTGTGPRLININFDFKKNIGFAISLFNGDTISFTIRDDITTLTSLKAVIHGWKESL